MCLDGKLENELFGFVGFSVMQLGQLIELNCHTEKRAVFVLAVVLLTSSYQSICGEDMF